jgi:hypothetical protein
MSRAIRQFVLFNVLMIHVFSAAARDGISFLHVRIERGVATVVEHSARPGRWKPDPGRGPLAFELVDAAGVVVHAGRAGDEERIEFPTGGQGEIGAILVEPPIREFIVRAPRNDRAKAIRLYREPPWTAGWRSSQPGRELIGIAEIPPPESRVRAQTVAPAAKTLALFTNGPTANRLNLVVLAEGFRADQESLFTNQAASVLRTFLDTAPYRSYELFFNGYAIFVPSNESGADRPSQNIFRDTYFSSTFEAFGIDRLLAIPPNNLNGDSSLGRGRVDALLREHMPEYDIVMMLVNDPNYGGSGGFPAIASLHSAAAEIVIHEVGHSFAGLGDEYEAPADSPNLEEPNTTRESRREFIKWRDWILASTPVPTPETAAHASVVGLFEGAHYHATGWYRPKLDCAMRTLGEPFCEVCREALILECHRRVNLLESIDPMMPKLASTALDPARMHFAAMAGAGSTVTFGWTINGEAAPEFTGDSMDLGGVYVSTGDHQIAAVAADHTSAVRNDPGGDLIETASWLVTVHSTREPVVMAETTPLPSTEIVFSFSSSLRATLVLESSDDLLAWIPVRTNIAARRIEWVVNGGSLPREFLRVKVLPVF